MLRWPPSRANELDLKKCYVVNDGQSASQGVVRSFVAAAEVSGLEVLGSDPWDATASSYKDLFNEMKVKDPDCLIISGTYGLNGRQLMKDKVAVLGNNEPRAGHRVRRVPELSRVCRGRGAGGGLHHGAGSDPR